MNNRKSNLDITLAPAHHAVNAERYIAFRDLVKKDHVKAQAMVWRAGGSRKTFDKLVDELREKIAK